MSTIQGRPAVNRQSVHPTITAEQISTLVDEFYGRVRSHETLGSIFDREIEDWTPHLEKMKAFWRSVLLRTGEYKGQPVPVHQKIAGIETEDFGDWLTLFSETVTDVMSVEAAPLVEEAAQRIATSLWLSRSSDPFIQPPDWSAAFRSNPSASTSNESI